LKRSDIPSIRSMSFRRSSTPVFVLAAMLAFPILCHAGSEPDAANDAPRVAAARSESPPRPDSKLFLAMLAHRSFGELELALDQYRLAYLWDAPKHEEDLVVAYKAFDVDDVNVLSQIDSWIEAHPDAYQAYTARAYCRSNLGWDARGTEFVQKTGAEKFALMERYFSQAESDARTALKLRPDSMAPYRVLASMAKAHGSAAIVAVVTEGLKQFPTSYNLRVHAIFGLQPRWGGSYEAIQAIADAAQAYVDQNPELRSLRGFPDWARGKDAETREDYVSAYELYTKALSFGDEGEFLSGRNGVARHLHRFAEAFADAMRDEQLEPGREKSMLEATTKDAWRYAVSSYRSGRLQDAIAMYTLLLEHDPNDASALAWRGISNCRLGNLDACMPDLDRSLAIDPTEDAAWQAAIQCLMNRGSIADGVAYGQRYVAQFPAEGVSYFWLALAEQRAKNDAGAEEGLHKACDLHFDEACGFLERTTGKSSPADASNAPR
jgi:tetratricopeptide (TPR) repeat protein